MVKRVLASGVLVLSLVGVVVAAEAIKLDLKDFKLTAADGKENSQLVGYNADEMRIYFYTNGVGKVEVTAPAEGDYTLTLRASCDAAGKEFAKIKVKLNDKDVKESFELTQAEAKEYKFDVKLKKGANALHVEFLNDKFKENEYDLNFFLHAVTFDTKPK